MSTSPVIAPVTVTLALVSGPGLPHGEHPDHRIEAQIVLDAGGRPDPAAWIADPGPWTARRMAPPAPPQDGAVHHDPDEGWTLRFWPREADRPEARPSRFDAGTDPLRPGEYVRVTDPDGSQWSYRVVGVTAPR